MPAAWELLHAAKLRSSGVGAQQLSKDQTSALDKVAKAEQRKQRISAIKQEETKQRKEQQRAEQQQRLSTLNPDELAQYMEEQERLKKEKKLEQKRQEERQKLAQAEQQTKDWGREGSTHMSNDSKRLSMREEAEQMRQRLSAMNLDGEGSSSKSQNTKRQSGGGTNEKTYSYDILLKKIEKLGELLRKTEKKHGKDSKEYKKLLKKRAEYDAAMEKLTQEEESQSSSSESSYDEDDNQTLDTNLFSADDADLVPEASEAEAEPDPEPEPVVAAPAACAKEKKSYSYDELKKKSKKLKDMMKKAEKKTGKESKEYQKLLKKQDEYKTAMEPFEKAEAEAKAKEEAEAAMRRDAARKEMAAAKAEAMRYDMLSAYTLESVLNVCSLTISFHFDFTRRESERKAAAQRREQELIAARKEKERLEKEALMEQLKLKKQREEEERRQKDEEERLQREQEEREELERARVAELERLKKQQEEAEAAAAAAEKEKKERDQEAARKEQEQVDAAAAYITSVPASESVEEAKPNPPSPKPEKKEASQDFLDRRMIPEPYSDNTRKLLRQLETVESRQKKFEQTLNQNGIQVTEEIEYDVAKAKIAELTDQMKELVQDGLNDYTAQKKYYALEEQMAKYTSALMLTDEWAEEQAAAEEKWEDEVAAGNMEALIKLRRCMPVNIRHLSEEQLTSDPSPNGKTLPLPVARKFKRTNVLQLIRMDPDDIEKMHPSLLEGLRTTGLTLTERMALYAHLKNVGEYWKTMTQDPSFERKWMWSESLKSKLKEMLGQYNRHVEQYGPPGNHPYQKRNDPSTSNACPLLGNQCPVKANSVISYDEDYGYPSEAKYEVSEAKKSTLQGDGTPVARPKSNAPSAAKRARKSIKERESKKTMDTIQESLNLSEPKSDIDEKLIQELFHAMKRLTFFEKQLTMNGLGVPADDISYELAKEKIAELTEELKTVAMKMGDVADMKEMARLESEYGKFATELEKYNAAMMLTKEWAAEQLEKEKKWEEKVKPANIDALKKLRRHIDVSIRDMTEDQLKQPTPNGKTLPVAMIRKFKRTNILMLLRMDPKSIEPMHPSSLEGLRTTGLTLTERRALYEHLVELGPKWKTMSKDKMAERKWMWHESLRGKFRELVEKYDQHVEQYGPPGNHPYAKRNDPAAGGCPLLGKQCPLKADAEFDYSGDYGFPEGPVYNASEVQKSNLLSVEEFQARQAEDEAEYAEEEASPAGPPAGLGGLLSAISARGK